MNERRVNVSKSEHVDITNTLKIIFPSQIDTAICIHAATLSRNKREWLLGELKREKERGATLEGWE